MGQIDEEERPFMIVDKDTGRVYDIRNDKHVDRLTDVATTRFGGTQIKNTQPDYLETQHSARKSRKLGTSVWGDWWKEKTKSNQELMWAAEVGDLNKLKKYLDKSIM